MSGSLNLVVLIGNLGRDPEIRMMQNGDRVCNLSVATSESWKGKDGSRQERTTWHNLVIFNQPLIKVCEQYLRKGSKISATGQLETRKWQDQQGQDRYYTEVGLRPYRSELVLLDSKPSGGSQQGRGMLVVDPFGEKGSHYVGGPNDGQRISNEDAISKLQQATGAKSDLDDEIPF